MLEVYAPVLDRQGRVVAVTEFYENSEELAADLARAQREGWMVTGSIFSTMVLALFLIVARGSNTIDEQRRSLAQRVSELWQLLRQHDELRGRVEQASRHATEDNERFLRRLGADLHDGPAQMISLALLRLDSLCSAAPQGGRARRMEQDLQTIRGALTDAMNDVRNLCAGLCLPEIEKLSLKDALLSSVGDHERRTRTSVLRSLSDLPVTVPHFVKICVYRFIQEALSNAFRHAGGKGQRVAAWAEGDMIVVQVEDKGPGLSTPEGPPGHVRLGLTGLWDRIESLGGVLEVTSRPNEGTRLTARLPVAVGGRF
jgi:signal transduction histidine kinase